MDHYVRLSQREDYGTALSSGEDVQLQQWQIRVATSESYQPFNLGDSHFLAGVYVPTRVSRDSEGWLVSGSGVPFRPAIVVTNLEWFESLRLEQNNFSYGFNRIRSSRPSTTTNFPMNWAISTISAREAAHCRILWQCF